MDQLFTFESNALSVSWIFAIYPWIHIFLGLLAWITHSWIHVFILPSASLRGPHIFGYEMVWFADHSRTYRTSVPSCIECQSRVGTAEGTAWSPW